MADRFWSCGPDLELGDYTLRRSFPLHFHPEAVVAVMVEGAEILTVDAQSYYAEAGSVIVVEPERAHYNSPISRGEGRYRGLYASPELFCRAGLALPQRLKSHVLKDRIVARRLTELHKNLETKSPSEAAVEVAREIADVFARMPSDESRGPDATALSEVERILRVKWRERVAWHAIAAEVKAPTSSLARAFRRHYGLPPHAFQTQLRIAEAKRLIRRGQGIASVAAMCGFVDQSHFTRAFLKYVGQTPGLFVAGQKSTIHS
jgi:AraC-like DNA-binding protein